jgi:uncharacterized protein (TIGR02271 family)
MKKSEQHNIEPGQEKNINTTANEEPVVIPVVQEHMVVDKEIVETATVHVRTKVREEEATVNVPIVSEQYDIKRVPVDKVFKEIPPVRYEGDTLIVPVIEEVVVVEKRYKVVEEVHLVKRTTETPFMQQVTLRKESVQVERTSSEGKKTNL